MADQNLSGRKCFALVRCSTKPQAGNSLPQQSSWLQDFADEHQMAYVGQLQEAFGVSQVESRPDINALLNRKRDFDDFDTVLVQDLSRLTRGGLEHGLSIYFEFRHAGIQIVSITDGLIDGEEKLKEAIRRFEEARAQVKINTLNMMRGLNRSRREGRCLYHQNVPYGIDKLFTSADGTPLYVIRKMPDGSQEKRDATNTFVLRTYPKNENGVNLHHAKQRDEYVTAVPGNPEYRAINNRIFRRRFVDGVGGRRIARELNDDGLLSASGKKWSFIAVQNVYRNPIYLGTGIANRNSWAIFYKHGKTIPEAVPAQATRIIDRRGSQKRDSQHKKPPLSSYRPANEWYVQLFPVLDDYIELDPVVKKAARAWQQSEMIRLASRTALRPGGDRYPDSDFILKGVLRSKQGLHKMRGCRLKKKTKNYRYYRVCNAWTCPTAGSVLGKLVPADMVEEAAIGVLKLALSSYPDLKSTILKVLSDELMVANASDGAIESLKNNRKALREKIEFYVESMISVMGSEDVKRKTAPLIEQLSQLDQKIALLEDRKNDEELLSPTEMCDRLETRCKEMLNSIDEMDREQVRHLLTNVVTDMTVDMATRDTTLSVRLPSWAISGAHELCAVDGASQCPSNSAYLSGDIKLGSFHCKQTTKYRPFCMECRRSSPSFDIASRKAA